MATMTSSLVGRSGYVLSRVSEEAEIGESVEVGDREWWNEGCIIGDV